VAGSCRVRRSWTFWGELWVRALGPRPGVAPAHAFSEQDAPYLAAPYLDAHLLCGLGERVQSPVGGPLLVFGLEAAAGLGDELARRVFGDQGDDPGALIFGDAGLAAGLGAVPETVHTVDVEAMEALSYGLRMAAELLGYVGGAQPCQLRETTRARKIQSPGAWRLPASL
jgi:hypothetical protein